MVVHKKGVKRAQKVEDRNRKKAVKADKAAVRRFVRQEEVAEKELAAAKKK